MRFSRTFAGAVAALALGLAGCQSAGLAPAPVSPPRDGVLVHLSKGSRDPHAVLMGLKMATIMQTDRDVLVYVDLDGIEVVLSDGRDLTFHGFESSRTLLRGLLDRNVPVLACPSCLSAAGRKPEDLLPGVRVAEKEPFFAFTRGRILTIDY